MSQVGLVEVGVVAPAVAVAAAAVVVVLQLNRKKIFIRCIVYFLI